MPFPMLCRIGVLSLIKAFKCTRCLSFLIMWILTS